MNSNRESSSKFHTTDSLHAYAMKHLVDKRHGIDIVQRLRNSDL